MPSPHARITATSYVTVILATLFWGGNFNAAKVVVRSLPPFTSAAVRFAIATAVVVAIYLATEKVDVDALRRHFAWYVALGLLGVFGFNVLFFFGMKYTSPINGALIVATNPLMTVLLSSFLLHERLRPRQRAGLLLSALGVVLVITGGSWTVIRTMSISIGDLFVLMACACWALYGVLMRRYLRDSSPLATTTATIVCGAIAMVPFAVMEPRALPLRDLAFSVWLALLYLAIPGAVLAYLFWNRAVATFGPPRASIFYNMLPVFTMLISAVTGDRIVAAQVIGGAIVIAGCVLSQLPTGTPAAARV
jgi:drug/metabolite transporter (DMT)-like permease